MSLSTVPRAAPTLSDGRVTLRAHSPRDVPEVQQQGQDAVTARWTRVPVPYGRQDALDFVAATENDWRSGRGFGFAIESEGRYAGSVDLRPREWGAADVGFALAPWARGRRVMSAAVRLAARWGFEHAGLDVLHWQAQVGNWESRRVAWAVGFEVEAAVPGLLPHHGRRVDGWIGALTRSSPMHPARPWLDPPRITGPGVGLRPHAEADVPRMVEACGDPVTAHWLGRLPRPYTAQHAIAHLLRVRTDHAAGRAVRWAVMAGGSDRMAGEIGVHLRGAGREGEIGYWTHPDARGRGLATAAVRLAARHALLPAEDGGLGLDRLLLCAAEGNAASRRVARAAGFTVSGRDRRANRLGDGSLVDDVRFDLVPDELPAAVDPAVPGR